MKANQLDQITLEAHSPSRPVWPYYVGAAGGGLLALASFMFLLAASAPTSALPWIASGCLASAGAVLTIAWIGAMKYGARGVAPMLGSFALPCAFAFAVGYRNDVSMLYASVIITGLSMIAFALGHAFARGMAATRYAAWVALVAMVAEFVILHRGIPVPVWFAAIIAVALLGGIGTLGFAIARELPDAERR